MRCLIKYYFYLAEILKLDIQGDETFIHDLINFFIIFYQIPIYFNSIVSIWVQLTLGIYFI